MKVVTLAAAATLLFTISPARAVTNNDVVSQPPFQSIGDGPVYFIDYTCFKGLGSRTFVEFYFQIGFDQLQFIKHGKQFKASYQLEFRILDEHEKTVEQYKNRDDVIVGSFDLTKSRKKARVSQAGFTIPPGRYLIQTVLKDLDTQHSSAIRQEIHIREFEAEELDVSDLQFSQHIEPATEGSPYVKNQRYIEPNATRTFAHELSDIFVYFEIYNLVFDTPASNSQYTAEFTIFNQKGEQVGRVRRSHQKPGISAAHSLRLPVSSFFNGDYTLVLTVIDEDTQAAVVTSKGFTVLSYPVTLNEYEEWFY